MYGFVMAMYLLTRSLPFHQINHKSHIVCDSTFIGQEDLIKSQNPSLYDMRFVELPIDTLLQTIVKTPPTISSGTSMFHKQRYDNIANKEIITYDKFCYLEKNIADIVDKYALDNKHHWCIFVNKNFLYADSFRRFLSKPVQRNILWVSGSVEIGFPDMVMWEDTPSSNI
jgi:hypothetical protein